MVLRLLRRLHNSQERRANRRSDATTRVLAAVEVSSRSAVYLTLAVDILATIIAQHTHLTYGNRNHIVFLVINNFSSSFPSRMRAERGATSTPHAHARRSWQCFHFFPLPQGHFAFLPILPLTFAFSIRRRISSAPFARSRSISASGTPSKVTL